MLVKIQQPATPGTVFAPDAFNRQIGETLPMTFEGVQVDDCRLVSADVAADGAHVELTLDVPAELLGAPMSSISIEES
jgi:hypothetical protein